jgi:hypothetical protein
MKPTALLATIRADVTAFLRSLSKVEKDATRELTARA